MLHRPAPRFWSRPLRAVTVAVVLLSTACQDDFDKAQEAHTIEAYEQYLSENPDGTYAIQAKLALEDLFLQKAREDGTLEGYDAYLERFPDGQHKEKVMDERKQFLFDWAAETDTPEGWQRFLDEYPKGDKKLKQKARMRKRMAEHRDKVGIGPVEVEQVNLAENPDGPLDGWGFASEITNNGDLPIQKLMFEVHYLDDSGKSAGSEMWPVVAERLPGNLPMEEGFSEPIAPGKSRTFEYTTGDLPAGWSKKVKLVPIDIGFVEKK